MMREDEHREFKKTTGELNEAMVSVSALLNKQKRGKVYFGPQQSCTRAQFVTFLWRLAGKLTSTGTKVTFGDITGKENYFRAIQWAVIEGIINGYVADNTFRPDNTVDRVSVAIMLWKYAGRPSVNISGKSPFKDISATNTPTLNSYKAVLRGYNKKNH